MAYATATDVANRLGRPLTPDEITLVETRLGDVERMILKKIPDLAAKIAAGDIDEEDVKRVEAEAVLRVVRNPEGFYSETDGDYTYTMDRGLASGTLEITPEEWAELGVTIRRGMFFIDADPVIAS